MITFAPTTPLETAVLEAGHFEVVTDSGGRDVILIGPSRLPKVLVPWHSDPLTALLNAIAPSGSRAFSVDKGAPFKITPQDQAAATPPIPAEEHLVIGLRALRADGMPVRIAAHGEVVRLFILPWSIAAKKVEFGGHRHFVVTNTRGIVGDWNRIPDGRSGMIIGLREAWVGTLERCHPGAELVYRADVPVPWIENAEPSNAAPTAIGVYLYGASVPSVNGDGDGDGDRSGGKSGKGKASAASYGEAWIATLPILMYEGTVVEPVTLPEHLEVADVPDGEWELGNQGVDDFLAGLT